MRERIRRPLQALRTPLTVAIGLVVVVAGSAVAGNGIGAVFNLGEVNTVDAPTRLTGTTSGPQLAVTAKGTGPALTLVVPTAGRAPMALNAKATGRVNYLNADMVDDLHAAQLQRRVTGTCTAGSTVSAVNADGSVSCAADAVDGGDAQTLDGLDSSAFLGATAKAADAENLDGRDSTAFFSGGGYIQSRAVAMAPGDFLTTLDTGHLRIAYSCPADLGSNGVVRLRNVSTETVNYFSDNGGTNPNAFGSLAPSAAFDQFGAAAGEHVTFQVQGTFVATVEVFSVHRASDCHAQAQATVDLP